MSVPAGSGGVAGYERVGGPLPLLGSPRSLAGLISVWVFALGPLVALIVVPLVAGWGVSILNLTMAIVGYAVSGFGVSIGFHRYLTHRAFKTSRSLRIAVTFAGTLALEGPSTQWVAHHRRHHAFADRDGDPHSPWRYGTSPVAVFKGLAFAHIGWMFKRDLSNSRRFAADMLADHDIQCIDRLSVPIALVSLLVPATIAWVVTGTYFGAFTGLLWAGLWRVTLLHHVTWSVNSICHVIGERPFRTRDRSTNFWPLAILSFGESWHNSHHSDPTSARHGVLKGQVDPSARLIWLFEKAGLVYDVRWPTRERIASRLA